MEAGLVGLLGAALGQCLALLGVWLLNKRLPDKPTLFGATVNDVLMVLGVAVLAATVAALYPAWRLARLPPAAFLRR